MLTPQTTAVERNLRSKTLEITLTPSGNYTTTGDNMHLDALTAATGISDGLIGFPAQIDSAEVIKCPFGYKAEIVNPGSGTANLPNWKLKIEETGAAVSGPFAEITAGAYAAGITTDVFAVRLRGPKLRF